MKTKSPTLKELKLQAKKLKISGYSRMSKEQLEKRISSVKRESAKENIRRRVSVPTTSEEASATLGRLSKGEARKLRKLLRKRGRNDLAAAERQVT